MFDILIRKQKQQFKQMHHLKRAVLLRDGQPVCYASKALTETEKRYSNIERETHGVVWCLERFHYSIYGKRCIVHTDHEPREAININNNKEKLK